MCKSSSVGSFNSNNFCKLAEKQCSLRNAPCIYQCGSNMCASTQTECKEYMSLHQKIKYKGLTAFIDVMSSRQHHANLHIKESLKRFSSNIKSCAQSRYEWQPNDVCVRERKTLNNVGFIQTKKVSVPCPRNQPYVCGNQRNYCSTNTTQLLSIKMGENEFNFIKIFRF